MHLQSIELSGYRSFAVPSKLDLSPHTTGLIGPNGCGKSTLLSAILWALGIESGTCIFKGPENHSPADSASVALTFSDGSEQLTLLQNQRHGEEPTFRISSAKESLDSLNHLRELITVVNSIDELKKSQHRKRQSGILLLDELDAPLDEAGITGFLKILSTLREHHQIILATHNKRTMAMSEILVAVTMKEYGISNLVSLNLST